MDGRPWIVISTKMIVAIPTEIIKLLLRFAHAMPFWPIMPSQPMALIPLDEPSHTESNSS